MLDNPLVTTEWLQAHLNDENLRIVDIRGHVLPASQPTPHYFNHRADYEVSHISGAVFIDWVLEITDPADPRHAQIAKPERYAEVMSRNGIDDKTFVVAYDDASGMFAARLWWSLNYYGHEQVAVLDGGWNKWIAEKRPVTADIPSVSPKSFIAKAHPSLYRNADAVLAKLNTATKIIDVRSPEEFRGEYARANRKGHIPGAINQPRNTLFNSDGTLHSPEQLRAQFDAIGINTDTPEVIVYCNGGVSASYGLLALQVAGLRNGAVYDGSWKDWGNDESKPIER
jgi:thiosulfate/3-mercaptopyruvate sulfurtransferase